MDKLEVPLMSIEDFLNNIEAQEKFKDAVNNILHCQFCWKPDDETTLIPITPIHSVCVDCDLDAVGYKIRKVE